MFPGGMRGGGSSSGPPIGGGSSSGPPIGGGSSSGPPVGGSGSGPPPYGSGMPPGGRGGIPPGGSGIGGGGFLGGLGGNNPATATAEQSDPNLVEVAVYGIAALYERYPPKPPAKPEDAAAGPGQPAVPPVNK